MLRFKKMKDLVLLPLRYVVVLIVCLILSSAVQVLVNFAQLPVEVLQHTDLVFWPLVYNALLIYALPSIGLTWLNLAFHILHRKRLRGLLLILLSILSMGGIFGALNFYGFFSNVDIEPELNGFSVPEGVILAFDDGYAVVGGDSPIGVSGAMLHGNGDGARFVFTDSGRKDIENRTLIFPEQGLMIPIERILGGRTSMFEAPGFFSVFAAAISQSSQVFFSGGG